MSRDIKRIDEIEQVSQDALQEKFENLPPK